MDANSFFKSRGYAGLEITRNSAKKPGTVGCEAADRLGPWPVQKRSEGLDAAVKKASRISETHRLEAGRHHRISPNERPATLVGDLNCLRMCLDPNVALIKQAGRKELSCSLNCLADTLVTEAAAGSGRRPLLTILRKLAGDVRVPAKTAAHAILDRHGLVALPGVMPFRLL